MVLFYKGKGSGKRRALGLAGNVFRHSLTSHHVLHQPVTTENLKHAHAWETCRPREPTDEPQSFGPPKHLDVFCLLYRKQKLVMRFHAASFVLLLLLFWDGMGGSGGGIHSLPGSIVQGMALDDGIQSTMPTFPHTHTEGGMNERI